MRKRGKVLFIWFLSWRTYVLCRFHSTGMGNYVSCIRILTALSREVFRIQDSASQLERHRLVGIFEVLVLAELVQEGVFLLQSVQVAALAVSGPTSPRSWCSWLVLF